MRARRAFQAIDSHTEGMATRVIVGGVGVLPGATMAERRERFIAERDDLRTLLMTEPRGHSAMSGAILQPPTRDDADWGVLFIEVSGCLPMCGHATIGVATVLVETGMVEVREPVTTVRLDTPAGLVIAEVAVADGRAQSVTFRNVASFLLERDVKVEVAGIGPVVLDLAWGGNFYAILPAESLGVEVARDRAADLIRAGLAVVDAVEMQARPVHPANPALAGCHHAILTAPPGEGADGRAAVAIQPGWLDRSPCGTGTSARLAQLHARGELALDVDYVHESTLGTRFTGRLVEATEVAGMPAVIPTITGRAWITGMGTYLLDPQDPFPTGFLL